MSTAGSITPLLAASRATDIMLPSSKPRRIYPLLLLLVLVHLANVLYSLPINRVIEMRLCRDYYANDPTFRIEPDKGIPEKMCKIDEVQRKLAWLQGVMETTLVICDSMVTIPFSFVAERRGIRTVLWWNLMPRIGMSIWAIIVGHFDRVLPTNSIVAASFLAVLGGECVFQSTVFTLTSALAKGYVQRASYFSYVSSTSYVVSFLGPTLAAFTMSRDIWLPFWINITLLLCAIPTIKLLPLPDRYEFRTTASEEGTVSTEESEPLHDGNQQAPGHYSTAFDTRPGLTTSTTQAIRKMVHLITGRVNFQILLISFFLTALASSDTKLLVQYISKRYEWTFAQAGYMLSAKAIVNFTLLAVVVPRIIRASRPSESILGSEVRLNYVGAEISILISVVGVLCVAFAFQFWMMLTALVIYALGSALPVFTISLVKSPLIAIGNTDIQDFSIVMLTKTLGSLVGAPLMTILWIYAIQIGGLGVGLPYLVSAFVYIAAAFVISRLHF